MDQYHSPQTSAKSVARPLVRECIALDLEVLRDTGRIHAFAAIRGDSPSVVFRYAKDDLGAALHALDHYGMGCWFVLGHNCIAFDLPCLRAVAPALKLLELPAIDTLRLSPLAFPRNPYHRLVKHYKDGALVTERRNDPSMDAELCMNLFEEELAALTRLRKSNPTLLTAWHWLLSQDPGDEGFARVFDAVRGMPRPDQIVGKAALAACLRDAACATTAAALLDDLASTRWPLAYALAWLSVAGANSVMPPWVRHEYPEAARLVRRLRDIRCPDTACNWCMVHHNPKHVLERWFGFKQFRSVPACEDGRPMQEAIVEAAMAGAHVLGILPTGTGKSVCYQAPALARYENTGALTIVISPLVALMADQVYGLQARGITTCAAINGLLSMPERADVLDRVRLGDIAILLVSPEQLRNRGFRRAIEQREIGAWVLDEAHCLSKWGHDFRTDYRYVGRFIRERAGAGPVPPVLCLTATAKPDVVTDICDYFLRELKGALHVFNGGAQRGNLDYLVVETTPSRKMDDTHALIADALGQGDSGGAIVYCATRAQTEKIARFLVGMGWRAAHFHAGLKPESKKTTQEHFIAGEVQVIAATNAFGMGIDKPDVRLVIHAEMPGSLENYVQEAGRAGRDQAPARCILLYCEQDIEQQFGLSARSRLPRHEIQAVLRSLRRLAGHRRTPDRDAEVIATPGEILGEDDENVFYRDAVTEDTRVRTAVSWLEEARLLRREENRYQVFPSSLKTPGIKDAEKRLASVAMPYRGQLMKLVALLVHADPAEGVTTDELMGASRLSSSGVAKAMYDLERHGILSNDSVFTALVHAGVVNASQTRFALVADMEKALLELLQEVAPELNEDETSVLHLRRVSQRLKDLGFASALPERIFRLLHSIAGDGRSDDTGRGSLRLRKFDAETVQVRLERSWQQLEEMAGRRRAAATLLLEHLLSRLPQNARGTDLQAETTLGNLHGAVDADLALKTQTRDIGRLVERALLWLHEQEIVRLGRGLVVFRPAMNIQVAPGNLPFRHSDYEELQDHYNEQVVQIHVMAEYARRGLEQAREALALVADYFSQHREAFIGRWFPQAARELNRQTTRASWKAIVESLDTTQRSIVTDERKQTHVLVLAGPGSGKTRVLVHRIAFLVWVLRENPKSILALAYNRHAASEIRRRLRDLIGDDAGRVTVLTCHGLAMRLAGVSFAQRSVSDDDFAQTLRDAVALLEGKGLSSADADVQRERLLAGFRWILVDEYQDIGPDQYALVAALAGRTLRDVDRRLSLFAVGDDDQNIYGFAGASVAFIRQFQSDYQAKPAYLTANYRSTAHIIQASNAVIAQADERMKTDHLIAINRERLNAPQGGDWEARDPVSRGRVQLLCVPESSTGQAVAVMTELLRLAALDPGWSWNQVAIIAREWKVLEPVLCFCEFAGISAQRADHSPPPFWRLRETGRLVAWLSETGHGPVEHKDIRAWLAAQGNGPWWDLLAEAEEHYRLECGDGPKPAAHFREWLAEWGREIRRQPRGLLLLTAHRVKGLEFEHVAVLDGGWEKRETDPDATRRLYYVAMTRARQNLILARRNRRTPFVQNLLKLPSVLQRETPPLPMDAPDLNRRHQLLSPKDIDLGFAGRTAPGNPVHQRLAQLQPNDRLELTQRGKRWLLTRNAAVVGRLSSSYCPPEGMVCCEARVHAVLRWSRQDGEPGYADLVRCDQWEAVLPELVFAAVAPP